MFAREAKSGAECGFTRPFEWTLFPLYINAGQHTEESHANVTELFKAAFYVQEVGLPFESSSGVKRKTMRHSRDRV